MGLTAAEMTEKTVAGSGKQVRSLDLPTKTRKGKSPFIRVNSEV